MEMQTFQGNSMAEALERVKQNLGPDAVILHTRTLRRGGVLGVGARTIIEITASRDANALHPAERRAIIGRRTDRGGGRRSTQVDAGRPAIRMPQAEGAPVSSPGGADLATASDLVAFSSSLRGEMGELRTLVRQLLNRPVPGPLSSPAGDFPEELREYYTGLIQNQVAEEVAREVVDEARARLADCRDHVDQGAGEEKTFPSGELDALVPQVMLETIERMIPPAEPLQLPPSGGTKYVAFVGPTGVGKTTTIAKLAAHFKLREGRRVGMITIDTYRIAAVEQIRSYADILSIPLEVVMTPEGMEDAVANLSDCDLVLIDTSGRSQRDARRLDDLKAFLDAARKLSSSSEPEAEVPFEVHLVLSCTAHPSQVLEVAEKFSALNVNRVVFTKLDEAIGLGVILNVIRRLNLRLSYLTTGQDVPDDIEVGHCRRIAELILGCHCSAKRGSAGQHESDRQGGMVERVSAARPVIDHVA